jgi:hypothetical protein
MPGLSWICRWRRRSWWTTRLSSRQGMFPRKKLRPASADIRESPSGRNNNRFYFKNLTPRRHARDSNVAVGEKGVGSVQRTSRPHGSQPADIIDLSCLGPAGLPVKWEPARVTGILSHRTHLLNFRSIEQMCLLKRDEKIKLLGSGTINLKSHSAS